MRYAPTLLAAAILAGSSAAEAATVTIATSNSGPVSTTALTGTATTGAGMAGMRVTATFANAPSVTGTWNATGPVSGSVLDGLVTQAGDTFLQPFQVLFTSADPTVRLIGLLFEGGPGNTLFDIVANNFLSPASFAGLPFTDRSSIPGTLAVTYSRPVAIGDTTHGDLFLNMRVDLSGLTGGGLASGTPLRFLTDADSARTPGDIIPAPSAVPVPAALPLMLGALGLLGWAGRRRSRA